MVDKRRRTTGGRVTPAGGGTRPTPGRPARRGHSPVVRIIAALAIAMLILTLAVGIIGTVFG